MNIYYEIIGYTGTCLVLLSMMMTSVVKLRVVNVMGSLFSMTYAILSNAWPVVFLNAGLIMINVFQLIRFKTSKKSFYTVDIKEDNGAFKRFIKQYRDDIGLYYPDFDYSFGDAEIKMIYSDDEIAGVFVSHQQGNTLNIMLDYTTPKYRDISVAKYLYTTLQESGVSRFVTNTASDTHNKYLEKIGFKHKNGKMEKRV